MYDLSEVEEKVQLLFLLMFDSSGVNNRTQKTPEVFHINKTHKEVIVYDLRGVALHQLRIGYIKEI
jgi:phage regulator Rha-like protein